ncbi:MAG: sulfurtransferase [Rhizobiales bacterium]|nr:sulfurtransferase [Hyphomicrobiales bacterium]
MPEPRTDLLVEPDWLEAHLGDPSVHVFDCSLTRVPQTSGASLWHSGREDWEKAHIPGAFYLHMIDDLCDATSPVPLTLARQETVASLLSEFGVTPDATIVLYGSGSFSVVHRVWWALTVCGAGDVRILDSGWRRWLEEGRPVEADWPVIRPAVFDAKARDSMSATRDDVASALGDTSICLIHSLESEQFLGTGGQVYGRAGRIPGSVNVPARCLVNPETGCFLPASELAKAFEPAGLDGRRKIIPYCGGGIAASTVFLALTLLGYDNVSLYDGSLLEWTSDPAAPMVTGPENVT